MGNPPPKSNPPAHIGSQRMCQHHDDQDSSARSASGIHGNGESFPWDLGAYDAHCHPTDTMASIVSIASMKARVLTVMATRAEDQDLVNSVASGELGFQSREEAASVLGKPQTEQPFSSPTRKVIAAFGWHPWFSYQLYDDRAEPSSPSCTYDPNSKNLVAQKTKHYQAVLAVSPNRTDEAFLNSLPYPKPLFSGYLASVRERLARWPLALIGEVGIDRAFRLPVAWGDNERDSDSVLTPGGREGRLLSPYRVQIDHQKLVLEAQLRLAGELGRAVSVHGVQAHGLLYEILAGLWKGYEKQILSRREKKRVTPGAEDFSEENENEGSGGQRRYEPKPYPPRICLHSFSGPPSLLQQYLRPAVPADIFFSFSEIINFSISGNDAKAVGVIRAIPGEKILVESDLHMAGERDRALEATYRRVCDIKGWTLREGVERIARNFEAFILG